MTTKPCPFHDLVNAIVLRSRCRILRDPSQFEKVAQDVFHHIWVRSTSFDSLRTPPFIWFSVLIRSSAVESLRASSRHLSYQPAEWWKAHLVSNFENAEQHNSRRVCNIRLLQPHFRPSIRTTRVCCAGLLRRVESRRNRQDHRHPNGRAKNQHPRCVSRLKGLGLNRQGWLPALDGDDLLLL